MYFVIKNLWDEAFYFMLVGDTFVFDCLFQILFY